MRTGCAALCPSSAGRNRKLVETGSIQQRAASPNRLRSARAVGCTSRNARLCINANLLFESKQDVQFCLRCSRCCWHSTDGCDRSLVPTDANFASGKIGRLCYAMRGPLMPTSLRIGLLDCSLRIVSERAATVNYDSSQWTFAWTGRHPFFYRSISGPGRPRGRREQLTVMSAPALAAASTTSNP
ncbi:hypothetical protein ACHAWF_000475, partial [Thalassiosira exigua]